MTKNELDHFYYAGNDLGAKYTKKETKFAVWAPTAENVSLKIKINGNLETFPMKRGKDYVYRINIEGDLLNAPYHYVVKHPNQEPIESNDPYGRGVTLNSEYSAVVDTDTIKSYCNYKPTRVIRSPLDAVIYEVGIRDFSEDKNSNIKAKGKYLGFIEKRRKTKGGHKAGLDYLIDLGISHVQLNPVIDFANVDDVKCNTYNWGYDTISFFALEGSYSLHPEDPMARLFEFKKLVGTLHKYDIRVNMDVVYNHIFDYKNSSFEKIVPGSYFRHTSDGKLAEGSGCGPEFASEKPMVRKAIVDSVKYFINVFDVDGFRFDLMGLLDTDTINELTDYLRGKKPDGLVYGEGWNMGNALPYERRACSDNFYKLHGVAFFNDAFRDVLNGPVFEHDAPGFLMGQRQTPTTIKELFLPTRFNEPSISVNYVECHDNFTIYDRLASFYPDEHDPELIKRIKLANALTLLTVGISFIHMGQEIGQSKHGLDNTYNVPKVNNLLYSLIDERYELVEYFKDLVKIRQLLVPNEELSRVEASEYKKRITVNIVDELTIIIVTVRDDHPSHVKNVVFIINRTDKPKNYEFEDFHTFVLSTGGLIVYKKQFLVKNAIIPPISMELYTL